MNAFDLAGARRAAEEGRLLEWTVAKVTREGSANRPLAAILRGQKPILTGPTLVPLAGLQRIAGGEPGLKYSVSMAQWEREIAPILAKEPEDSPPVLLRYGVHVADGNHRVDAWLRRGETHGWAILWDDSDPRFKDWWGSFLPSETPTFETDEDADGLTFRATLRGEAVGSFRLEREPSRLTLRDLWVAPSWRNQRLGSRMLRVARPLMDGHVVHALAPAYLTRFFSETGFLPVEAPEGLQDWISLRREP